MNEDFLLGTDASRTLYHDWAEDLPIIDYHCHINPREIYENRRFENLTQAWLEGDHYKWRVIRANGVPEEYITGQADDREKFQRFAEVMPKLIGNPLYHWTHLELKRYFGIDIPLSGDTAEDIWKHSMEKLPALPVRDIIKSSRVEVICTTDDPTDNLEWLTTLSADPDSAFKVFPTFRPDKAVRINKPGFVDYIHKLSTAASVPIHSTDDVKAALCSRMDAFVNLGCRASDHALERMIYRSAPAGKVEEIFKLAMDGHNVSQDDADLYMTSLMVFLGRELYKRNIVMQLHYGALRDVNAHMYDRLGPDTGYDCIGSTECSLDLARFMNALERTNELPRTVIYSLNPNDNAVIASVAGCFQGPETASKIQHGSAWWYNDTKEGMERHLTDLANLSVLGNFIGMLTDSRSFLSYTRHEYFRRILCGILGQWVENGEYPYDITTLGRLVSDISYYNARNYFNL